MTAQSSEHLHAASRACVGAQLTEQFRMKTTAMSSSLRSILEHALASQLHEDLNFNCHLQFITVVKLQTMFSTVKKENLQSITHCARLAILKLVEEFLEREVRPLSQTKP